MIRVHYVSIVGLSLDNSTDRMVAGCMRRNSVELYPCYCFGEPWVAVSSFHSSISSIAGLVKFWSSSDHGTCNDSLRAFRSSRAVRSSRRTLLVLLRMRKDAGHKERLQQLHTSPACTTATTHHAVTNPAAEEVKKFRTS